jgi:hypothetical protein
MYQAMHPNGETPMTRSTASLPLAPRQITTLAVIGAVYWFIAAMIVRATAAGWVGNDRLTALVFGLIVPGTVVALLAGYRLAGVGRNHAAIGATIMTGTASLLDGLALTRLPSLYGETPGVVLGGAAAILWAAGVALVLGIVLERR